MLLKTVYQWDIDTGEDLERFQEESLKIDRQVERTIYRCSNNIHPGEIVDIPRVEILWDSKTKRSVSETYIDHTRNYDTDIPFMEREEFLARLAEDMGREFSFRDDEKYQNVYHEYLNWHGQVMHETLWHPHGSTIPRLITVRAVVEHRNGTPVRAEFLEVRGEPIADLPDPNAAGIIGVHGRPDFGEGFVMEDSDGKRWVDTEMMSRMMETQERGYRNPDFEELVHETVMRTSRRDLDDQKDIVLIHCMPDPE